jgi:hypothetical protein
LLDDLFCEFFHCGFADSAYVKDIADGGVGGGEGEDCFDGILNVAEDA